MGVAPSGKAASRLKFGSPQPAYRQKARLGRVDVALTRWGPVQGQPREDRGGVLEVLRSFPSEHISSRFLSSLLSAKLR